MIGSSKKDRVNDEELPRGAECVLVVEDEDTLRLMLKNMLEEKGYSVLAAADGEDGLRIYEANKDRIDIVITDLGLPKLSGEQLFFEIRQQNPQISVIVATGFLDPELKSELFKAGAKEFIQKPYSKVEILRKTREVLDLQVQTMIADK